MKIKNILLALVLVSAISAFADAPASCAYTDSINAAELEILRSEYDATDSAEQIEQAIDRLNELKASSSDAALKNQADALGKKYFQLYKNLTIKVGKPTDGSIRFNIMLRGKPFRTNVMPSLGSNCATNLEIHELPDGYTYEITYSEAECIPEEDNFIELDLRIRHANISKMIYLN